jgi:cyclic 2,3-diphosphoglycerate synthetase
MGRGGPPEPRLLRGDAIDLAPKDLLALAEAGEHAASDFIEDALLARVPTIGCRRCGGGLAGGVDMSNVAEGVALANSLAPDILLLEGSGSALPPVHADVTALVVPADIDLEYLVGYMGPYRLLLADLAVVTMCEEPFGSRSQISAVSDHVETTLRSVREARGQDPIRVVRTVFRPTPTRSVEGAAVFVATTAPEKAGRSIRDHLELEHRCRVVGMSHSLADRTRLDEELNSLTREADILLCEIKAAGVDVATRRAVDAGVDVVYMDNVPHGIDGDDLDAALDAAARLALERFARVAQEHRSW